MLFECIGIMVNVVVFDLCDQLCWLYVLVLLLCIGVCVLLICVCVGVVGVGVVLFG